MKKVLLVIALFIGAMQFSKAQIDYGIKAGLNFASPSDAVYVKDGNVEPNQSIDANTSWHAGGWARIKVPIIGLYVRPEVMYTSISTSVPIFSETNGYSKSDYKLNRIDIPVLVGLKFLGVGNVFAGPVFEYVLTSDIDNDDITSIKSDDFFVGAQIGIGLEFRGIGLDVRYETAFSSNTSDFGPSNDPSSYVTVDNAPNQFIVGLSYNFSK